MPLKRTQPLILTLVAVCAAALLGGLSSAPEAGNTDRDARLTERPVALPGGAKLQAPSGYRAVAAVERWLAGA